jgi:hypothetical protein
MSWFLRIFSKEDNKIPVDRCVPYIVHPQLPPGFVKRSDPNFFFLSRKF